MDAFALAQKLDVLSDKHQQIYRDLVADAIWWGDLLFKGINLLNNTNFFFLTTAVWLDAIAMNMNTDKQMDLVQPNNISKLAD
jgi:hypothetical protein